MQTSPSRRPLTAAIGATTVASTVGSHDAGTRDDYLAYRPASGLVQPLANREVSARELVDAAIARIEALDPKVNAVVVRDFDRAREAADDADTALGRGERRPLLGLPMTVKEQYNVAGLPTCAGAIQNSTAGSLITMRSSCNVSRPPAPSSLVRRTYPRGLGDWQSCADIYGATNNPWDTSRTPGGSSGGSAAALAAGFVPLELGSDIAGSLRAPAHFCGVCAHKPSLELVPQRGSGSPERPPNPVRGDMEVNGPMARSAADLALASDVIAGPDEMWEGIAYKLALPPPRHDKLADFRVLVTTPTICRRESGFDTLPQRRSCRLRTRASALTVRGRASQGS